MKVFSLILSLYFFTASVFPCSDEGGIVSSSQVKHAAEQTGENSDDDCTSLCICNCCGIVFEVPDELVVPNAPLTYSHRIISQILHPQMDELSTIWQPPRIS